MLIHIRKDLTKVTTCILIHSFITSKLDNMNSLYYGITEKLLDKLQQIQNTAARLITGTKRRDHITPVLADLHWLPIRYRIRYKIILLAFKCQHSLAPPYLCDLLKSYQPTRSPRSSTAHLLDIPRVRTMAGKRRFSTAAPILWNNLPEHLRNCHDLNQFRLNLKTILYKEAFDS